MVWLFCDWSKFLNYVFAKKNVKIKMKNQIFRKYTGGITPKHVTSGWDCLRKLAPGNTAPKKPRKGGELLAALYPI